MSQSSYSMVSIRGFQPRNAGSNPADCTYSSNNAKRIFVTVMYHVTMGRKAALRRKAILYGRMNALVNVALSNAGTDPVLAYKQASIALRLCSRHRIRMPYNLRMLFCRRCKSFIVPGVSSHVRIGGSSIRSIRTTCSFCGFVYRKILV